jgi:serine protease Do
MFNRLSHLGRLGFAMFSIGFGLLCTLVPVAQAAPPAQLSTEKSTVSGLESDTLVNLHTFSRLAKALSPAVVNIHVTKSAVGSRHFRMPGFGNGGVPQAEGVGTGFIIHPDGYALTNNHVIDGAAKIEVKTSNDEVFPAKLVGRYARADVALIKITANRKLPVAALGNSDKLEIAEWVIAIGNPFGLNHTVTAGIVSAKGRHDVHPGNQPLHANFIQTDASINPGNSGGPLINTRGEVVGINTAINAAGQGIGFAVPINMVKKILPQLARGKVKRSYLGVKIGNVSRKLAAKVGLVRPTGALVTEVVRGTPAYSSGLQPGDVVTHWDGQEVRNADDLSWRASTQGQGRTAQLRVRRRGKNISLSVKLSSFPGAMPTAGKIRPSARGGDRLSESLGLSVKTLTKAQRRSMRLGRRGGITVTSVDRGSASHQGGLRGNDVIVQVNYIDVKDVKSFMSAVEAVSKSDMLMFHVIRGDRKLFVAFTK